MENKLLSLEYISKAVDANFCGYGRFEMDFLPILDRSACLDYKLIVSDQHQVYGRMSGMAVLDDGTKIEIKDVLCFAEKVHNRY